jgi:hypothetical protein
MLERLRAKLISNIRLADGPLDSECWIWQRGRNSYGYGAMWWGQVFFYTHRVSYMIFIGSIPKGMVVRHRCHVKACCSPYHLRLGTHEENMKDKIRRRAA